MTISIEPVLGLPEVREGDDLAGMIVERARLNPGDIVVVAQKIVSKAEGRLVAVDPARRDEERARLVASEAVAIVARRGDLVIVRTRHGLVCAHAGIDASNVRPDALALLPKDPDASARAIRDGIERLSGARVGVIVSDTFGRPWRVGQTNVAIGVAGLAPLVDYRGARDEHGTELKATVIAIADELAGAAELVMGKTDRVPAAVVRGFEARGDGSARDLVRPPDEDLFPFGSGAGERSRH